jgi:hypothetical protein
VHERGRLLQGLEHPVGRLVAELVGAFDDEHASAGLERRLAGGRDDRTIDVGHEDLVGAARDHPGEIRVRTAHHARAGVVGVGLALGEQLSRERTRGGALAGTPRPVEEISVRRAARRLQRRRQDRARVRMSFELGEHQLRS